MTHDIVERLRKGEGIGACLSGDASFADAAMKAGAHEIDRLRSALDRSRIAIDDWLNIYASDMCDEMRVAEARRRVNEHGTLWYIADVQRQNREALALADEQTTVTGPPDDYTDQLRHAVGGLFGGEQKASEKSLSGSDDMDTVFNPGRQR